VVRASLVTLVPSTCFLEPSHRLPIERAAKSDFDSFVEGMTSALSEHVDDTIPTELPLKDLVFRIYRDIRFSNDHTPYKTHLSAAWSRTGKKGPYACYYVSIQPGKSLVGGGLWHPDAQPLGLLRRDVDRNPVNLKAIIAREEFADEFLGDNVAGNEQKAVKAFLQHNSEDALKKAPKNYPKDHKDIELLRLRSYTIGKRLADEQVLSSDFLEQLTGIFKKIEPLITYLNGVVMPDISGGDDDDDDDGSDDGADEDGEA